VLTVPRGRVRLAVVVRVAAALRRVAREAQAVFSRVVARGRFGVTPVVADGFVGARLVPDVVGPRGVEPLVAVAPRRRLVEVGVFGVEVLEIRALSARARAVVMRDARERLLEAIGDALHEVARRVRPHGIRRQEQPA
jgi:hypothetical protein